MKGLEMTTVMEVINQAIGTWGFPIAMCLVLVWYVVRKDKQHREDMRALREEQAQIRKENKEINENNFTEFFDLPDMPDVDLIIRTGGEKRLSNFLLWHGAYAELDFVDTLWPDYNEECFYQSIKEFQKRNRRFGGL